MAEESIEFLTFVYWTGKIADQLPKALARAARRGVRASVLLDGFGAAPMHRELIETMSDAGVRVEWGSSPASARRTSITAPSSRTTSSVW